MSDDQIKYGRNHANFDTMRPMVSMCRKAWWVYWMESMGRNK
jgi:hypothetical protein